MPTPFDRTVKALLALIALFLGMIAVRPYIEPTQIAFAESRFDHLAILSTAFLRNGRPGLLILDKRNANVWYMQIMTEGGPHFGEPEFLVRVPFDKLDQSPQ